MPRWLATTLVVVTSAAVLVLEILALRLVAPYVGLTLESYTACIGVALLGIAAGARLGGLAADRRSPRLLLGPALVVGGLLVLAVRPLVHLLGPALQGYGPLSGVLLVGASTLAPIVVLSAVPPGVVKLRLADLAQTGRVVGQLSALGTVGALAGSVVTGFVLVRTLPTSAVLAVTGGVVVALGLLASPPALRRLGRTAGVAALAGAALVVVDGPCAVETAYYCARVVPDAERAGGRVLLLDDLRHAYVDLDDPRHLEFAYTQWFGAVVDAARPGPAPLDVLHVGGGGFTMPRWLAATRPGSTSTVLELDPSVVRLARTELGLTTGPDLAVVTGDARRSIADVPAASQDVVVGDAFGSLSVPWHLATREFAAEVRRVLRPDGVYVANVIDRGPVAFLEAEAATLRSVFTDVAVVVGPGSLDGPGGNFVVVASDQPLPVAAMERSLGATADPAELVHGAALDDLLRDAPVLTDDYAPVDQLITPYVAAASP